MKMQLITMRQTMKLLMQPWKCIVNGFTMEMHKNQKDVFVSDEKIFQTLLTKTLPYFIKSAILYQQMKSI